MRYLYLLFIFCCVTVYGQPMQFDNLTSDEGLPQNTVSALLEDAQGFIWIGTRNGLCRFDGEEYKYYTHNRKDTAHSLLNNNISCLAQDKQGNIWVGNAGQGGLNLYYYKEDRWVNFPADPTARGGPKSWTVTDIIVTQNGEIWFCSGWSLQQAIPSGDSFIFSSYHLDTTGQALPYFTIFRIAGENDNILWLATSVGLVKFDKGTKQLVYGEGQLDDKDLKRTTSVLVDRHNNIWVGFEDGGVAFLTGKERKPGKLFDIIKNWPADLLGETIHDIIEASDGTIYFATGGGMAMLNTGNGQQFSIARHTPDDPRSLASTLVLRIMEDAAGNLWLGTERGLSRCFKYGRRFYTINSRTPGNEIFRDRVVRILADDEGYIWTAGQGTIQRTHISSKKVVDIDLSKTGVRNIIGGLAEDGKGNVWGTIAPWLVCIDKKTLSVKAIPIVYGRDLPEKNVTSMAIDTATGYIWLGATSEVICYDPIKKTWKSIPLTYRTFITGITITPSGRIFVADAFFLFEIDKQNMMLKGIEKNGNGYANKISYLQLAKDILHLEGRIYIAHKDGLLAYDINTGKWLEWHTEDGLPAEVLRALTADKEGNLWISTDRGLACLKRNGELQKYDNPKLLTAMEFNSRATATDNDGHVYFGSDKGLTWFNPAGFSENSYSAPVRFTKFELFNKEVPVHKNDSTNVYGLPERIEFAEMLQLDYSHKVFTVSFVALNYLEPEKNIYAHRLIGFDEDWINDGNRNSVTFTNLEPGDYELLVKTANSDGVWSDKVAALKIHIAPPWYKTWWAYAGYLLLTATLVWLLVLYRIARVRKQARVESAELRARTAEAEKKAVEIESAAAVERARQQERETMRKKSAQDFHDEAGIKLTRIGLLTTVAKQKSADTEVTGLLNKIEENTSDLSSSMRDFIWVLDPDQDSLYAILQRLQDFGNKLFEYSDIEFKSGGISEHWQEHLLGFEEKRHLILIFKEAMNNALKYSAAKHIMLSVKDGPDGVHISLADDGKGFDAANRKGNYGLRNMGNRAEKMQAGFHLQAVPGGGVKIEVILRKWRQPGT